MTVAIDTIDYYTDRTILDDPHNYFRTLLARGPVVSLPYRNVMAVTGYDEAVQVMLDNEHFSTINALTGPIPGLPFEPRGDDISDQLEKARPKMAFADLMFSQHGKRHTDLRSLLSSLFTPRRLKAIEPKIHATGLALIGEFKSSGKVDLVQQFAQPFATLMISDLLGVAEGDRRKFRELLGGSANFSADSTHEELQQNGMVALGKVLFKHLALRRILSARLLRPVRNLLKYGRDEAGNDDILTQLALARFPDGAKPSAQDITSVSALLFAAGQDTTAHLLANSFKIIATRPDIQQALRMSPNLIPNFIEEVLRYDGPVKSGARLCQRTTTVGGVKVKAGTTMLLSHMGANRDPRRFDDPATFEMDRKKAKEHLAFGRGPHTCPGAALARREAIVAVELLLANMGNIRLSNAHGQEGNRTFHYEPSYVLRSMRSLNLDFDPIP